jgi:type IV fimbrial biogenesis protein FimT
VLVMGAPQCRAPGPQRGFTLIELMVTIAVIAIFSALAGPAFREMIASQRVRSGSSALNESLWLARSEAVKRNADDVTFTLANGTGSSWSIVTGATTLHTQEALSNVTWQRCGSGTSTVYTFNRYGRLTSGAGKMQLGVADADTYRCVTVSVSGRATVEEGTCTCS